MKEEKKSLEYMLFDLINESQWSEQGNDEGYHANLWRMILSFVAQKSNIYLILDVTIWIVVWHYVDDNVVAFSS
jgi:hypothetical protein